MHGDENVPPWRKSSYGNDGDCLEWLIGSDGVGCVTLRGGHLVN